MKTRTRFESKEIGGKARMKTLRLEEEAEIAVAKGLSPSY